MDEEYEISKLEESLEGPYLIRVEQPVDAEKTFIAPSKTLLHPLSDDEEEFSLDSLDFNFTNCGESNGRRSIIGQINHNHNLTTIAADYASTSAEEETLEADQESQTAEPVSERTSDTFDPFDLMVTKKVFNFSELTPKQAAMSMAKLSSRLDTSKRMYPTMIKDNMMRNLQKIESDLRAKIQDLEDERQRPLDLEEDEENNLLLRIIHQLEHKLHTLEEKLHTASDLMKVQATD